MLSECATKIKPTYTELLDAVFRFDCAPTLNLSTFLFANLLALGFKHDQDTLAAYSEFLLHLNTANASGAYAAASINHMVKAFIPRYLAGP